MNLDTAELQRLTRKHRDIALYGAGALERQAAKQERQDELAAFASKHDIGCFKCGTRFNLWAKTGFGGCGAWAICVMCVRTPR